MQYIESSTPDNVVDDTTQRLHQIVEQITTKKGEHDLMTLGYVIDYETKKAVQTDLVENIAKLMKNLQMDLETACIKAHKSFQKSYGLYNFSLLFFRKLLCLCIQIILIIKVVDSHGLFYPVQGGSGFGFCLDAALF